MSNTKQTAVEWLVKHLSERGYIQAPSFGHSIIDKAIDQAKEMDKQNIINAFIIGNRQEYYDATENSGEQYYNETYGGNK